MTLHRILLLAVLACAGLSQLVRGDEARGRIIPGTGPDRDTIDFGYLLSGNDSVLIFRSIHFINDGTQDLIVRDSELVVDTIPPTNPRTDFQNPARFPLHVTTANGPSNPLHYDSIEVKSTTFLKEAPEGWNRVRMHVRLALPRTGVADSIVSDRTFILQFYKTLRPLWTPAVHVFDSVYVGGQKTDTLLFRNSDVKRSVRVLDTVSELIRGLGSDMEFRDTPLRSLLADSGSNVIPVRVRFSATHRGEDSIRYYLTQINPSSLRKDIDSLDSTRVMLVGVGVEQDVHPLAVHSRRGSLVADTIDVGSFTVGASDTIVVYFQNQGNCNYRARAHLVAVSPTDTIPFEILDSLSSEHHHVGAGSTDSMRLVFHPTREASFETQCVFRSDIDTRVSAVPEAQKERVLVLRGRSTAPKLRVLNSALHFEPVVVFDQCPAGRSLNLRLQNTTGTSLHVDKPTITPADGPFTISPESIDIPAGMEGLFSVKFAPRTVDQFSAQVSISSTVDDVPMNLSTDGVGLAAQTMPLALPSELRAFPGHAISVPLLVDPALVSLSQIVQLTMSYDSSLLQYDHTDAVGTAAAGGLVTVDDHLADRIVLQARVPDVFQSKDTLVKVVFRTSLGYADRCDLSISAPAFGLDPCSSVMPSASPSTVFLLDSLCGLQSKILQAPLGDFLLSEASPNPAHERSSVVFTVAFPTEVHLQLLNSIGEVVEELCHTMHAKGAYSADIDASGLADGVYYVKMQAGLYTKTRELVISH